MGRLIDPLSFFNTSSSFKIPNIEKYPLRRLTTNYITNIDIFCPLRSDLQNMIVANFKYENTKALYY